MAREGWTSLMLRKETLARLKAYRDGTEQLRERGLELLPRSGSPAEGPPSMDATLNRLLDLIQEHRDRAAVARAKGRFDRAWTALSCEGKCDGTGSKEYERVWSAWMREGFLGPVQAFILAETNVGPNPAASAGPDEAK